MFLGFYLAALFLYLKIGAIVQDVLSESVMGLYRFGHQHVYVHHDSTCLQLFLHRHGTMLSEHVSHARI